MLKFISYQRNAKQSEIFHIQKKRYYFSYRRSASIERKGLPRMWVNWNFSGLPAEVSIYWYHCSWCNWCTQDAKVEDGYVPRPCNSLLRLYPFICAHGNMCTWISIHHSVEREKNCKPPKCSCIEQWIKIHHFKRQAPEGGNNFRKSSLRSNLLPSPIFKVD